jgi:uncharacterized membrane protein
MTQQLNDPEVTSDDKLWAALGYPIPLVALIMFFMEEKKKRAFIKFHAVHALILVVGVVVLEILFGILRAILSNLNLGIVNIVFGCITPVLWLLLLWPAVLAYQGKKFEVPVVTKFARDQHWIS